MNKEDKHQQPRKGDKPSWVPRDRMVRSGDLHTKAPAPKAQPKLKTK